MSLRGNKIVGPRQLPDPGVQPGNTVTPTAPYAVASGDGLLVGSIFGVAAGTAALGETIEAALIGASRAVSDPGSETADSQHRVSISV